MDLYGLVTGRAALGRNEFGEETFWICVCVSLTLFCLPFNNFFILAIVYLLEVCVVVAAIIEGKPYSYVKIAVDMCYPV